jgi:hypothetical protein
MEWVILSFDNKSGAFSAPGDSGAVVADGSRYIGGTGWTPAKDITYVTSINSVMEFIKVNSQRPTSTRISAPRRRHRIHSRRNLRNYPGDAGEVVRGGSI